MSRRVYWIILIISIIAGLVLFIYKADLNLQTMLTLLFPIIMAFIASIHGIIAHSLNPNMKGGLIVYPVLMGVLFAALFFICVFFIIPLFCPDFMGTLW